MLSDAAHSGLDLTGAALTFFSVQVCDKPADEDHTYGHGKIENLSAVWRGRPDGRLLRVDHLGSDAADPAPHRRSCATPSGRCWCLLTSIAVDFWRSRQLRAVAERTGSPALATDAFHFASDIWSTLAVLAGLGASWVGTTFGHRLAALRRSVRGGGGLADDSAAHGCGWAAKRSVC